MFFKILVVVWLALAWGGPGFGNSLQRSVDLLRSGDAVRALEALDGFSAATPEDEVSLLWIRALAMVRLGQPNAAIPLLERLVALAPERAEYRLELAYALSQVGQTERALFHIGIARGSRLPPVVDARVAEFEKRLQFPKVVRGHFTFAVVPESNPTNRTSAREIFLGGLPFVVNPDARAKAATGLEVNAGLTASPQIAPGWRAQIGFSARTRFFGNRGRDDYTGRVFAGVVQGHVETGQTRQQVFLTRRWLDKRHFSHSHGVSLGYARRLSPATRLDLSAVYENLSYSAGHDLRRKVASVALSHMLSPQLEVSLSAHGEQRDSSLVSLGGDSWGAGIGAQYQFKGGLQASLNLNHVRKSYDGLHPLFGIARQDDFTKSRLRLANNQWNWKGFAPVLDITYEKQDSSVVLNRFRNVGASIGVTRRF